MRAILDIFLRDLVARLRDRSAIVVGVLAPLGLIIVLSLLVKGPDVENQPIGYVPAASATPADQVLRAGVFPQMEREKIITVHTYRDRPTLEAALNDQTIDAGIVVTAAPGGRTTVEAVRRSGAAISGSIAEGIARNVAAQVNGVATVLASLDALG